MCLYLCCNVFHTGQNGVPCSSLQRVLFVCAALNYSGFFLFAVVISNVTGLKSETWITDLLVTHAYNKDWLSLAVFPLTSNRNSNSTAHI